MFSDDNETQSNNDGANASKTNSLNNNNIENGINGLATGIKFLLNSNTKKQEPVEATVV
jgi:hypothetical protein